MEKILEFLFALRATLDALTIQRHDEPLRARRLLSFLLAPECGLGPHRFAGIQVGWTISGGNGTRRYGLFAGL